MDFFTAKRGKDVPNQGEHFFFEHTAEFETRDQLPCNELLLR